jgi:hypothetical protein
MVEATRKDLMLFKVHHDLTQNFAIHEIVESGIEVPRMPGEQKLVHREVATARPILVVVSIDNNFDSLLAEMPVEA